MLFAQKKGQAMLETAIALPVVILIVFGCIVCGTFVYNKAVVFLAANRGVDAGIGYVYDTAKSLEERETKMREAAENMAKLCIYVNDEPVVKTAVSESEDGAEILLSVSVEQTMRVSIPLPEDMQNRLSSIKATSEFIFYKGSDS